MFNFFKNKKDKEEPDNKPEEPINEPEEQVEDDKDDAVASVTYYVKKDSSDIFLDIFIEDYEEETLKKMSRILSGLSSLRLSVETMNMVKNSLFEAGAEETFLEIVRFTMEYTKNETNSLKQLTEKVKESTEGRTQEDQPWIKPSEIIR